MEYKNSSGIPRYSFSAYCREMLSDLFTPVGVYMNLRDLYAQSILLESSDYHGEENSRSFIGLHPIASFSVEHGVAISRFPDGIEVRKEIDESFHVEDALQQFLNSFSIIGEESSYCGLYGYTSFNAVRYFENIEVKDYTAPQNDAPDILYVLYQDLLVFDHFNNRLKIVSMQQENVALENVESHLDRLVKLIGQPQSQSFGFQTIGEPYSTLTDEEHKENIRRCIEHCLRGDVFQIVISRRFVQKYKGDDFKLYRSLRSINPSPYLFYFDFGGFRIFGSSPETHCRINVKENVAYIDPIAGTTPRTGNRDIDKRNAEFLRNDDKENAEHTMLVDLARNDLSRNCENVKVDFFKDMQFYSHVIHLVSRVSGKLRDSQNSIRAFVDTFPAGTLSGAPKVRAMQIISQLEPHCRGVYGGCIGFIGFDGQLNQAIVIRTFISRSGELSYQAGSGIVSLSDPDYELNEVNTKLAALTKAIKMATL